MSCTTTCVRPTPAQAHCAAADCHRTFNTVSGFDSHRRSGMCVDPVALGMTEKNGSWRMPLSESRRAWLARIVEGDSRVQAEPQGCETGSLGVPGTLGDSEAADSRTGEVWVDDRYAQLSPDARRRFDEDMARRIEGA
jgi:hypothetical protein